MARSRVNDHARGPGAWTETRMAAAYRALLEDRPDLAEESYRALVDAHAHQRLYIRDRMLCNVLRPRFLEKEAADRLGSISTDLAAIFEHAGEQLLASPELLTSIGASEQELELWSVDPGYPGFTLTSRLDSFIAGGKPRFVEYNAESPASIGFCDCLTEIFLAMPVMRHFEGANLLERFDARQALLDTLLWAYRQWGGADNPTVAIVDWDDVVTKRDFELCAEYFRDHGIRTFITDPRELRYDRGKVWYGDERIDVVYRRVLLHELLCHADEARPLLDAYADGAICLVNSPRSKVLHKKALLALISDPDSPVRLTPDHRALVEETIPWTRQVLDGSTTFHGEPVDLIPFALASREHLTLKPSDEYGGKGVVLGWETTQDEWERAIESTGDKPYVLQERVNVAEAEFPVWSAEGLKFIPLLVDTDPLLFRGRMRGILTRISGNALLNVSAGSGSTTPTFLTGMET
ncbi:MAG: hypothetical protein NVSMB22_15750 [Chloroflexota bacterium]